MSLYKVKVDCVKEKKKGIQTVKRVFLVEAETTEWAAFKACEVADKTAAMGPKWLGFEFREVFKITLPLELKE